MKLTDGWSLCGIKMLDEKTQLLPIYFHSVGHYPGQKHVFRPEGLGQYQICICTKGSGVFSAMGKEYDIKKGDMFFFVPCVGHEYYPVSNDWTVVWVVFNGTEVKAVIDYFDMGDFKVKHLEDDTLDAAVAVCESLYATYNRNESYDFDLTVDMLKLVKLVNKGVDLKVTRGEDNHMSGSFSPVIDYIKKNYMLLLTLDDIAETSRLSKSHFSRMFKDEYGVTPMAYLNRYRVSVAKFLLTTTVESIETIAGKTGFSDTSYFCAVFKKFEGCSPAQYRSKHK